MERLLTRSAALTFGALIISLATAAAQDAEPTYDLKYVLKKGDVVDTECDMVYDMKMTQMARGTAKERDMKAQFIWQVVRTVTDVTPDGNYVMSFVFGVKSAMEVGGRDMTDQMRKQFAKLGYSAAFTPKGALVTGTEDTEAKSPHMTRQATGFARMGFMELPKEPVKVGDSWLPTRSGLGIMNEMMGNVKPKLAGNLTLKAIVDRQDRKCAQISWDVQAEPDPDAPREGHQPRMAIKTTGVWLVALDDGTLVDGAQTSVVKGSYGGQMKIRMSGTMAMQLRSRRGTATDFVADLRGEDAPKRLSAIRVLGAVRTDEALAALTTALGDSGEQVRVAAEECLTGLAEAEAGQSGPSGPAVIPRLAKALGSESGAARAAAIRVLTKLPAEAAALHLVEALREAKPTGRAAAAKALGSLEAKQAVVPLTKALSDPNVEVQLRAAFALTAIGQRPAQIVPILCRAAKECGVADRREAVDGLADCKGQPVVTALVAALRDSDQGVKMKAAVALAKVGDKAAVPPLVEALTDNSPNVRRAAASSLGKLGEPSAIEPLMAILNNQASPVRPWASLALVRLGEPAAMHGLVNALKHDSPKVRKWAARALAEVDGKPAVPALIVALDDSDEAVRLQVADTLSKIDDDRARQALDDNVGLKLEKIIADLKKTRDYRKQQEVEKSLAKLGQAAVPKLMELLKERDWKLSNAAVGALSKIGGDETIEKLAEAIKQAGVSQERYNAARALGQMGEAAVPALAELAQGGDTNVRTAAIQGLGYTKSEKATDLVLEAIEDTDVSIQRAGAGAASTLNTPRARKALIDLLKHTDTTIRLHAANGLAYKREPEVVAALIEALRDSDTRVQHAVVRGLAYSGRRNKEAASALFTALKEDKPELRAAVAEAIGRQRMRDAAKPLTEALDDPDLKVRQNALKALARIGGTGVAESLAAAVRKAKPKQRAALIKAIGKGGSPAAKVAVKALEEDGDPNLKTAIAGAKRSVHTATCKSNLKQIGLALLMWRNDNKGKMLPKLSDLCDQLNAAKRIFVCPADKAPKKTAKGLECSYDYVAGLSSKTPPSTIVAYDNDPNRHGEPGRNVLCYDGHVEWMSEAKFQERLKGQGK